MFLNKKTYVVKLSIYIWEYKCAKTIHKMKNGNKTLML